MDTQLKIFALEYVKIHDGLLKEEKLAIGQFIMESSDDQVKFMLATGEVKDDLTEEDKNLLEASGWGPKYDTGHYFGKLAGQKEGVAAAIIVATVATLAYKTYQRFLSKAARACKEKGGTTKTNCMAKYRKQAKIEKVKVLQSGLTKCTKSKDPASCKSKLQTKINKEKAKMGAL